MIPGLGEALEVPQYEYRQLPAREPGQGLADRMCWWYLVPGLGEDCHPAAQLPLGKLVASRAGACR